MSYFTILTCLLTIITTSFMLFETIAFFLPMIPIDSPHLQTKTQSFNTRQRHQFLMNISFSRASMYALERNPSSSTTSLESPVLNKLSNYFVTQLSFGSRPHMFSAFFVLDTGSDMTWVQCHGCNPCFEVKGENIQVQLSHTYKVLSVNDSRCQQKRKVGMYCDYECQYGGGTASTKGVMGTDTFIFMDSNEHKQLFFQNVAFGCGLQNKISFGKNSGPENTISGVFGISPGPQSFLTQLDAEIKGRFSYCLVSWADLTQAGYGKSTMYFGDVAQIREPNIQQIPMNTRERKRYHLYFRGISVDGKRLPIDPLICSLDRQDYTKGFYIDSGAPYTLLPKSVYQPLRAAMVTYFGKYKRTIRKEFYDLCYSSTPKAGQRYPSVVFHFAKDATGGEVDWVMNQDNMFVRFGKGNGFCMGVMEMTDIKTCLFGAYQQANFVISYDVRNSILSFAPKKCQEHQALG